MRPGTTTDDHCPASAPLGEPLLMEIARRINKSFDCEQLAVELKVSQGSEIVDFLRSIKPHIDPHEMAFKIMKTWQKEKDSDALGQDLYDVLRDKLKMKDVEQFKKDLLRKKTR